LPPRLIITADDFGAALPVNEAVELAHKTGILTAASLMVAGAAAADAVQRARQMPMLGVGLHIVLVDGTPILPPSHVPLLTDKTGQFHPSMLRTALMIALVPDARNQMRAEVAAQFAAFAATGLPLDHANAHKHFHLHPMIAAAMIEAGRAHGLKAIRVPAQGWGLMALWARLLGRIWRAQGLATNRTVQGLTQTGQFTPARMAQALARLPKGLTEIYTHPATADAFTGSAQGYQYRAELAALTAPETSAALEASQALTGTFAQMARR